MRRIPILLALALLTGCGMSEERFATKASRAWCDWLADCGELERSQYESCQQNQHDVFLAYLQDEDCEYRKENARGVLEKFDENLELAECDGMKGQAAIGDLHYDACRIARHAEDTGDEDDTGDSGDTGGVG